MFINLLKWSMLAMMTNLAFKPIIPVLSSCSGYIMILCSYLLPLVAIKKSAKIRVRIMVVYLILWTLIIFAAAVVSFHDLNFDLIKNLLLLLSTYYAISISPQKFSNKDLRHIFLIGKLLSLLLIAYAYLPFSFRYPVVNEWGGTQFTMGLGNQNATSITIMFCISLLLLGCIRFPSTRNRVISYLMIAALMGALVKLQCRTVVACCLLLLVIYFFKDVPVKKIMVTAALLIPVLFIFVQIWLGTLDSSIEIMGKSIATGRQKMFAETLNSMIANPFDYILGSIGKHQLTNLHNAPITIVANFGILGFMAYCGFWKTELNALTDSVQCASMQKFATFIMLLFVIHSAAEAGVMLGAVMYGTQLVILDRLAKDQFVGE